MSHQQNILRIKAIYDALEEMADEVVFVGGATVSLYADRPASETRPTDDVDILIELAGYSAYADIETKLRSKGFVNDLHSKVICRYLVQGIIVDVMPTDETILGFSNRWYKEAFATAVPLSLDENYTIRILKPELFIATKLDAFKGRGENDGRTSSDFEDIVHVLNNRSSIWEEMEKATPALRKYLKETLSGLLKYDYFYEWVSANLDFHEQKRAIYILGGVQTFTGN